MYEKHSYFFLLCVMKKIIIIKKKKSSMGGGDNADNVLVLRVFTTYENWAKILK